MGDYATLRNNRFISDAHAISGTIPHGWCLRDYIGAPVPGNCLAVLSPPNSEYPNISIRQVTGYFASLDALVAITRTLIAARQCTVLSPETDRVVDGFPARELHYRDGELEIINVFVLRDSLGFSVIASNNAGVDKDLFHRFVDDMKFRCDSTAGAEPTTNRARRIIQSSVAVWICSILAVLLGWSVCIQHGPFIIRLPRLIEIAVQLVPFFLVGQAVGWAGHLCIQMLKDFSSPAPWWSRKIVRLFWKYIGALFLYDLLGIFATALLAFAMSQNVAVLLGGYVTGGLLQRAMVKSARASLADEASA